MRLTNRTYTQKSEAELRFILKDASDAAAAVRNHDSQAEAKYLEQIYDASTVLAHRARQAA